MKKVMSLFALVLTLVLVSSCDKKKTDEAATLEELLSNKWQILDISGNSIAEKVNDAVPYLSFDKAEKRYSVVTGCNNINGDYTTTDHTLKFGLGMSTMMFCDDMSVENGFKDVLEKITSYKIEGNDLTLSGSDNKVLAKLKKFTPAN